MSQRKSQLDRAIDALQEKRDALLATAKTEAAAIESAILTLQAQRVTRRASRSRPVAVADVKAG